MNVRYPEMRHRLFQAVSAICDRELHDRLWLRGERLSSSELGFHDALLFVVDEMEMFPPADLVGDVLIDEAERNAFERLTSTINALIEEIGPQGSYDVETGSRSTFRSVMAAAGSLQELLEQA